MAAQTSPLALVRGAARRARRTLRPADVESRLMWIFGSPRSGTTWLLQQLRGHPAVVAVNEPLIGASLGTIVTDIKGVSAEGIDADSFLVRLIQRDKPDQFFADEFRDVWLPKLADLLRARFEAHARRYPAEVPFEQTLIAIKEPNGSQSADLIMGALPRARMLFLLRDGRDVVDSELAAMQPGAWLTQLYAGLPGLTEEERLGFVELQAKKWLWRTEMVERVYAAHPGPKHRVRYEGLLADPVGHLRAIFDWLELAIGEAELQRLVERNAFERVPEARRGPKAFTRAASPGLWRQNLSEAEQRVLGQVLGPKLRELGYGA